VIAVGRTDPAEITIGYASPGARGLPDQRCAGIAVIIR
jgi:hypothetical protein